MEKKFYSEDAHLWKFQTFVVEFNFRNTARDDSERLSPEDVHVKIKKALLAGGIDIEYLMVTEK